MRTFFATCILAATIFTGCSRHEVKVKDSKGNALKNAHVYVTYSSDPKPPKFLTNELGIAKIPSERANKKGWAAIIAVYWDKNGKKYTGSSTDSSPSWPIVIQVKPQ